MAIDDKTIANISNLARLNDHTEDTAKLQAEFIQIVAMCDQISTANTDKIVPMAHPFDISTPMRDDKVTEHDDSQTLLALSDYSEANLFIVPKVIE